MNPIRFAGMISLFVWSVTFVFGDHLEPPPLFIEGYAGRVSCRPGEEVGLHVSTSAAKYSVEIARLGATREIMLTTNGIYGASYPVPENASSHGCGWTASFKLLVPEQWKSGYYQAVLRVADSGGPYVQRNRRTAEGECFFVVRPAQPGQ